MATFACGWIGGRVERRPRITAGLSVVACVLATALLLPFATIESDAEAMFTPAAASVWADEAFSQVCAGARAVGTGLAKNCCLVRA